MLRKYRKSKPHLTAQDVLAPTQCLIDIAVDACLFYVFSSEKRCWLNMVSIKRLSLNLWQSYTMNVVVLLNRKDIVKRRYWN